MSDAVRAALEAFFFTAAVERTGFEIDGGITQLRRRRVANTARGEVEQAFELATRPLIDEFALLHEERQIHQCAGGRITCAGPRYRVLAAAREDAALAYLIEIESMLCQGLVERAGIELRQFAFRRFLEKASDLGFIRCVILPVLPEQHCFTHDHASRRIGTRRQHPVEVFPQGRPVADFDAALDQLARIEVEERHLVVIALRELVGRHDGLAKHAFPRRDVRPGVGQRLEQAEGCNDLADTADILPVVTTVFGITGVIGVAEIEDGNPVTVGVLAQQLADLPRELGIGRRYFEVLVTGQSQVHRTRRQECPVRRLRPFDLAEVDQAIGLETANAGVVVAVDGIRAGGRADEYCNAQ
ncbi:MAG: hypothetical protein P8X94_15295 [Woeseiaceae bacterium]